MSRSIQSITSSKPSSVFKLVKVNGRLPRNTLVSSATFSPELVDFSIYIIDVAQGEKIPRKGGQGMIK